MKTLSVWVVRDAATGLYIGRDGKLTRYLNRAAYFTSRKVARLAAERFQAKYGVRFPVRSACKAELNVRTSAAVAA
jgi:hypothetical protein